MPADKLLSSRAKPATFDPIGALASKVGTIAASRSMSDDKIGALAIATESVDSSEGQMLVNVVNNMESTIKSIVADFGLALEAHSIDAATMAGVYATNPRAVLASRLKGFGNDVQVISANTPDGTMDRQIAVEAYDERENRNAQMFSIVYNLLASRQDEFGETLFPTITINPAEVGILISVKMFYVYNDFKRSVTGALADYGRVSVIRAYADHEILKNELTRAIPVLRTGGGSDDNSDKFAPAADVTPWTEALSSNVSVQTSALKVDTRIDLIGISQTNELLNSGLMGPSDTLDAFVELRAVYLKITDGTETDVIRVSTEHVPSRLFTYAPQGNSRRMILTLDSDGIVLDKDTLTTKSVAPKVLTELADNQVRLHLSVSGSVILDKSEATVNHGTVSLVTARNNAGQLVNDAAFKALADKFATAEIVYHEIKAYRANSNIRQRGQLLDSQIEYRVVQVPYRSPISVIAPTIQVAPEDTSVLQTLITTTGIRISNDAVTAALNAITKLASYKPVANRNGDLPELSDIGHYYTKPTYYHEDVNMTTTVDSRTSHEKIKDIRAALVEKIRFYANELYRSSEYQAAAAVLTGNIGFKPTVIVATDPVIKNYIMADGELRTLGESFDVKVVSTLDHRFAGKIMITFGVFDATRNTAVNPLNSGNMLYAPEIVTTMPVSRDGQVSNEVIVSGRWIHIWNLPVIATMNVTGLPEVTGKVTVFTREV